MEQGLSLLLLAKFLPRDAMHKRGRCCHVVFVMVSVTFVYCVETAKHSCYGM